MSTSSTPPPSNQPPTPRIHHQDAPRHDASRQWGTSSTPPPPSSKRRGPILLAAAIGVALLFATVVTANGDTPDPGPAPIPPTSPSPGPTDPPAPEPTPPSDPPNEDPEPAPETVEVPELSGITRAGAEQTLADYGLKATIKDKATDQYPSRTVISQSPKAGALVLPGTTVTLVVAKARPAPPPPPPSTAPSPPTTPAQNCDPSYPDVCLDPAVEDYDCAGGSGNGPEYVEGPIRVRPPDPFDLDREGDGWGCENG
jgi:PASTA domain-containing protein